LLIQKYQPHQILKNLFQKGAIIFCFFAYPNLILFGESSNAGQNKNNIIMKDV